MVEALRAQYEAFPYPARNPADEARRLITGSPSHLDEIVHYVFGGRFDPAEPKRFLVAGGGTGDGTIMLAQQLADRGSAARVLYLDLSLASQAVASARAQVRGLANIDFHQGSLLDLGAGVLPAALDGPFDYIDCCGVLHHLPDPDHGLRALTRVLAPEGGIGLMVYAPYGRTGVYPLQAALRTLTAGIADPAERIALARRLLRSLPPTNWLRQNRLLSDHQQSDAGLYDLLLHSCDRPYTVRDLVALVERCGLAIAGLIEPARYQPRSYTADPRVLARLEPLPWLERAQWAEEVSGSITRHIAYLVHPHRLDAAVARPATPDAIPVLRDMDGPAVARDLRPGGSLKVDLNGHAMVVPLPRLAGPILARVDGRKNLAALQAELTSMDGSGLPWELFASQFDQLYAALNGINKMLLRLA